MCFKGARFNKAVFKNACFKHPGSKETRDE